MHSYKLDISEKSVWNTATPTQAACAFPFYVTEAGIFFANEGYFTERADYDSFMMIYTISGSGVMKTENEEFLLLPSSAVVINCQEYHAYKTSGSSWEFIWLHFNGQSAPMMYSTLYPAAVHAITLSEPYVFEPLMRTAVYSVLKGDLITASELSACIHTIFNFLLKNELHTVQSGKSGTVTDDIVEAVRFIEGNYSEKITIDDVINKIHISKFHFIRLFRRVMGVTPYAYLTNYRITQSKLLLRTTNMSVGDIALACGFSDTSNFIMQFKNHTGEKPTEYRSKLGTGT